MKLREQPKSLLQTLNPRFSNNGVFNTKYTLDELEDELNRREQIIRKIEKNAEKNHNRKKRYLKKAGESMNQRKIRFATKAKEAEMHKSFFSELFDNLMAEYLFLTKLVLEAKRRRIYDSPMEEFGFDVDIAGMDVAAVTNALHDSEIHQEEVESTIQALDTELETGERSGISLNLDDIKEEADMLSASDMDGDGFEIGESWNNAIDSQIKQELDRLEDQAPETGEPAEDGT